jgi:hypothetical protein
MENGINLIDIKPQNTEQGIMNAERLGPKGALELWRKKVTWMKFDLKFRKV